MWHTDLNDQRRGAKHIRSVYAIEIGFNFWYARSSCGGSKAYTERSSNKSQKEVGSGEQNQV
ncbi:hypothetical protein IC582_004411 [Cucumis melo]